MKKYVVLYLALAFLCVNTASAAAQIDYDAIDSKLELAKKDACATDGAFYLSVIATGIHYFSYSAPNKLDAAFKNCLTQGYKAFGSNLRQQVEEVHPTYNPAKIDMLTALYLLAQQRLHEAFNIKPTSPTNDLAQLMSPLTDKELRSLFHLFVNFRLYREEGANFMTDCLMEDYLALKAPEEVHAPLLQKIQHGKTLTPEEKETLKNMTGTFKALTALTKRKQVGSSLQIGTAAPHSQKPNDLSQQKHSDHACAFDPKKFWKAILEERPVVTEKGPVVTQERAACIKAGLTSPGMQELWHDVDLKNAGQKVSNQLLPTEVLYNYARYLVGEPQNPYTVTTDDRLQEMFRVTDQNAKDIHAFLKVIFNATESAAGRMFLTHLSTEGWELLLRCKARQFDKDKEAQEIANIAHRKQRQLPHVGSGDMAALQEQLKEHAAHAQKKDLAAAAAAAAQMRAKKEESELQEKFAQKRAAAVHTQPSHASAYKPLAAIDYATAVPEEVIASLETLKDNLEAAKHAKDSEKTAEFKTAAEAAIKASNERLALPNGAPHKIGIVDKVKVKRFVGDLERVK